METEQRKLSNTFNRFFDWSSQKYVNSVRRILRAKYRLGLFADKHAVDPDLGRSIHGAKVQQQVTLTEIIEGNFDTVPSRSVVLARELLQSPRAPHTDGLPITS